MAPGGPTATTGAVPERDGSRRAIVDDHVQRPAAEPSRSISK